MRLAVQGGTCASPTKNLHMCLPYEKLAHALHYSFAYSSSNCARATPFCAA
jgi:hypothetical protein